MYLNQFASDLKPLDLTQGEEFENLLASARDLGIGADPRVTCVSRHRVVNGVRLHFLEWGDPAAPPILLVHGGGQTAHSWDLVSLALASRFHVVAMDMRGHGDSEWPRDGEMATRAIGEDIAALAADLELDRPVIAGHSLGGLGTMFALVADPQLARRAAFVDTSPQMEPNEQERPRVAREEVTFDSVDDFVDEVVKRETGRSREHVRRTARYNIMQRTDGKWVQKPFRSRTQAPVRAPLAQVRQLELPVLLLHGAESTNLSADRAERFAAAMPDCQIVHVPDCGHNVHSQNTPGFLAAFVPFVTA
ncbi:MAG: alpha/beta hydrolase [Dehalococcoidia bacterium]|nr:alpha/beta hydrolase [Dehalococcoidia bacterium]